MAPELLAHHHYSQGADVFSFAVVMWECLTRQLPYQGMISMTVSDLRAGGC